MLTTKIVKPAPVLYCTTDGSDVTFLYNGRSLFCTTDGLPREVVFLLHRGSDVIDNSLTTKSTKSTENISYQQFSGQVCCASTNLSLPDIQYSSLHRSLFTFHPNNQEPINQEPINQEPINQEPITVHSSLNSSFLRLLSTILMLFLSISIIYSQYDNRRVLLNQARRMEARRDFDSSLDLYRELMREYPRDEEIAEAYFTVLISLNKYDEAEKLLESYPQAFRPDKTVFNKITLYGRQGEMEQAKRIGLQYLQQNPGVVNLYKDFALAYERIAQYETAIEVLQMCRRQTGDEYIFAIDKARIYQVLNKYREAVSEYIKHLERNSGFLYMVADRINSMLDEDAALETTLKRMLAESEENILIELYALTLNHTGQYEKAYEVYRRLGPEKLLAYADELTASGRYELAVRAYEEFYNTIEDPIQKAEVKVKIASIYIAGRKYYEAKQTLLELTHQDILKDRQYRFRTQVNRVIRGMLAELAVRMDRPKGEIIGWLDEAKNYAFNQNEQREIDLKKVRFLIMLEDYDEAGNTIDRTLGNQPSGSRVYHISFYYRFLLDLMLNDAPSDSLLAEMIINIPGDELTDEALFLSVITNQVKQANRNRFLKAYRLKSLYREKEAIHTLIRTLSPKLDSLYVGTGYHTVQSENEKDRQKLYPDLSVVITLLDSLIHKEKQDLDEEILLIAAYWAYESGDFELAATLFSYPFVNDAIAGFAALRKSEMLKDNQKPYMETVTSFLQHNPHNVLAPQLRVLLTKPGH